MTHMDRRNFLAQCGVAAASTWLAAPTRAASDPVPHPVPRKMTIDLACGSIGVKANQAEAIDLAHRHGFESVQPVAEELAALSDAELKKLLDDLQAKKLAWGAASRVLPDFRTEEAKFTEGMKQLPKLAAGLQRAGVTRVGTYLSPRHETLTYLQNFKRHTERLRQVATVLADHGLRLGLEYVGPKTMWSSMRHAFVHTMAEMKELIAAIDKANVGFVLDSWHWYTARESEADLLSLSNKDIVAVDLNDAPAGIPVDQQVDHQRELPCATGVIDLSTFLNALNKLGYDGPVRAEPFDAELTKLPKEQAVAKTAQAMKKAFMLLK